MGHTRLGNPPTTKKWKAVIASISSGTSTHRPHSGLPLGSEVEALARQVVDAAAPALEAAISDKGLNATYYLLTQVALASRSPEWLERLGQLGLAVDPADNFLAFLSEFQTALDDHFFENDLATDIGEMARQAAGEALSSLASDRATTLFGEDQVTVQKAIQPLSTKAGFARLGQEFFGAFMARLLNFYLSRITADKVGQVALPQLGDLLEFNNELRRHCIESAYIVRDFSGEWYSKTNYFQGIDRQNLKGFLATALRKLQAELARQRED